jgi:hypothetical protein
MNGYIYKLFVLSMANMGTIESAWAASSEGDK